MFQSIVPNSFFKNPFSPYSHPLCESTWLGIILEYLLRSSDKCENVLLMILPNGLLFSWIWHFIANVHQLTKSNFIISTSLSLIINVFLVVVVVGVGYLLVVVSIVSFSVVSFLFLSFLLRRLIGWSRNLFFKT